MDSKRPATYMLVSDEQRAKLITNYNEGMKSTLEKEKINQASKETGLPVDKIKKWIGNQNTKMQKRSRAENGDQIEEKEIKRVKGARKLTAQNVFYSSLSREGKLAGFKSNGERHTYMSIMWHKLGDAEKQSFKNEAERLNKNATNLTQDEKCIQIQRVKKMLINNIMQLEQLGVESASMILDENKDVSYFGSRHGIEFLNTTPQIDFEFRSFFDVKEKDQNFTYKDLQIAFNKAYAKAINCKNAKVPYLKGNFEIEAIPDDIPWRKENGNIKKPSDYGQSQINRIMTVKESITFKVIAPVLAAPPNIEFVAATPSVSAAACVSDEESPTEIETQITLDTDLPVCMLKIVEEEVGLRALNGGRKIGDSEIDVFQSLRDEEVRQVMDIYSKFFTEDALDVFKKHYASQEKGVVLATYTDHAGVFWLFYYEGFARDLANLNGDDSVLGYWLDKKKGPIYRFLNTATSIQYRNIVKDDHQSVISWKHKVEINTRQLTVDREFLRLLKRNLTV